MQFEVLLYVQTSEEFEILAGYHTIRVQCKLGGEVQNQVRL
jgi:hypothetical protein